MADIGEHARPIPRRPSDAISEAFGLAMEDKRRWPGRMGTFEVRLLVALREIGWDVTPKRRGHSGGYRQDG